MMNLKSSFYAVAFVVTALTFTRCGSSVGTAEQLNGEKKYALAAEKLIDKLAKEPNEAKKAEITYQIAENYMSVRKYDLAAQWYENAEKVNYSEAHPEVIIKLADAYKATCRYEEALKKYNEYLKRVPNDKAALNGAKACELAVEWEKKPTRYELTNVVMLNTANDDVAPIYMNKKKYNQVLFYSYRSGTTGGEESEVMGQNFPDLFAATLDAKGKWSIPAIVTGDANSPVAEGASAYDFKNKTLYFTRCSKEKKENTYCAIYSAKGDDKKLDGSVQVKELGPDTFNIAQPALSPDGTKLYFVSNMPGGQGGNDIWVSTFDKGTKMWGSPVNLGPEINTAKNEMFPFIHADGTLYFSSNGHIGIGGYDLFKAASNQSSFGPVVNLKVPLNSCGDDVAIVFEDKAERGYVTSNRTGSKGGLDIWSFVLHPVKIVCKGVVSSEKDTAVKVAGAKITVKVSDNTQLSFVADANGRFEFDLAPNMNYTLSGKSDEVHAEGAWNVKGKLKYFSSKDLLVSTINVNESKNFECRVVMPPIPTEGIELPNIEYEFNKSVLTPEAKLSLNTLVTILLENPTLSIELGSHTDFRGSAEYNRKLAQARAESAVRYLIEKGIDASRMKAKGFGEDKPKVINEQNLKFVPEKYRSIFPIGTVLDEKFINSLKTKELSEAAHQLNRRTEFQVLCTDWSTGKAADACVTNK
jgi:peptidoglycan-associated lipoprotein